MATGINTSQGWSPQMVTGTLRVPVQNNQFLMNQMSLTSTPRNFAGENQTKFGNHKKVVPLIKKVSCDINYLKRV
jgi:hypothetical protein